ncbi:MAG: ATP-binding protein, partial [Thermoplasmata archaeon]|nr:ATP-binding protein [Thermoplasmata archaeon]
MDTFPAPVLRALEGLSEGSGRTLVIAGPPLSGKSELLQAITAQLVDSGHRVIELKGEYRERDTSYAALAGLGSFSPGPEAGPEALAPAAVGDGSEAVPSEPAPSELPTSALAYMTPDPGGGRRPRGERRRGMIMGQAYVTRPRAAESRDPQEFWSTMVADWRAHPNRGTAVLVEDAALVDPESREFLVLLSERARLRPFLIVLALDNGSPAFGAWEERLLGHGDVDWVKIPRAKPDPREAHRLKDAFERLPDRTQQVLGYTALMGGHVSEVSLSRVTRMNWRALADALLPATEAKLVKIDGTKVVIPHDAWIPLVPDLLPDDVRKEMHREIAEALAALNPEPSLVRRLELAEHYYQWYRGPNALRYLLETAELTERLSAFDTAEEVLEKALKCVPSLPVADRPEAEAELKLFHARVLVAGGRIHEGERALQEGVAIALAAQVPQDRLAEWVEAILPVLRAAGPRPSLVTHLMELADRCHDVGAISSEVLFQSVIAEYEVDRNRPEKARIEARRAVDLSRTVPRGPVQAMALLTVALTRVEG